MQNWRHCQLAAMVPRFLVLLLRVRQWWRWLIKWRYSKQRRLQQSYQHHQHPPRVQQAQAEGSTLFYHAKDLGTHEAALAVKASLRGALLLRTLHSSQKWETTNEPSDLHILSRTFPRHICFFMPFQQFPPRSRSLLESFIITCMHCFPRSRFILLLLCFRSVIPQ